ncbi:hypothetical protein BJ508DRAFT_380950 [Ascobolus immersus RN42]|uniref:Uncharacterized protein n=1 Tax=Ascobolus immersus RN42 TaxID=1160509 RepID=A0A3N4HII2_ASCIM|nr:hypothetical protein BJ508DRAFT_380950 [Ascobolus immersus RN42]
MRRSTKHKANTSLPTLAQRIAKLRTKQREHMVRFNLYVERSKALTADLQTLDPTDPGISLPATPAFFGPITEQNIERYEKSFEWHVWHLQDLRARFLMYEKMVEARIADDDVEMERLDELAEKAGFLAVLSKPIHSRESRIDDNTLLVRLIAAQILQLDVRKMQHDVLAMARTRGDGSQTNSTTMYDDIAAQNADINVPITIYNLQREEEKLEFEKQRLEGLRGTLEAYAAAYGEAMEESVASVDNQPASFALRAQRFKARYARHNIRYNLTKERGRANLARLVETFPGLTEVAEHMSRSLKAPDLDLSSVPVIPETIDELEYGMGVCERLLTIGRDNWLEQELQLESWEKEYAGRDFSRVKLTKVNGRFEVLDVNG